MVLMLAEESTTVAYRHMLLGRAEGKDMKDLHSTRRRRAWVTAVALVLSASFASPASAHQTVEEPAAADSHGGLGDYGPDGPITPDDLEPGRRERISDEALAAAQDPALALARASWDQPLDFVHQVHYQLRFRSRFDFLSSDLDHLGQLLRDRPENVGVENLGLFMTDAEADELLRRQELGDRLPDLARAAGEEPAQEEGAEPTRSENFAGVWQDQLDGGRLVVAVVDPSKVDRQALDRLAGGSDNLKVIDVDHSWDEVNTIRDRANKAIQEGDVEAGVRINSTSVGRVIDIYGPDLKTIPADIVALVPDGLGSLTQKDLPVDQGNPNTTHPESEQQPGLRIEFDPGGNCTWGANGHTSSYNYMVFAGHCGPDPSFLGWSDSVEIHQNNSFHLTPGSQFFYSKTDSGWDMERASSPQADSNCYHAVGSCVRYIRWRALHNSWETNSDLVCASLGNTNDYECGLILEEYSTPPSSCTIGNRAVRYDIDTGGGDSGSGLIGPVGTGVTIDAIHTCGDGTEALGQTAYDVKNQLAFDYNCASSKVTGRSAGNWGSCPTYNR